MKIFFVILLSAILLVACSGNDETPTQPVEVTGGLKLRFVDSYHINDSTVSLVAAIEYRFDQVGQTPIDSFFSFPDAGSLGDIFELEHHGLSIGGFNLIYTVSRPFIILGPKDNTGDARFIDTSFAVVEAGILKDAPQIEIWAYVTNHLIVYFDESIGYEQADNIIRGVGARILSRQQSIIDGGLFYRISTSVIGIESEIKPIIAAQAGVRNVYFEIFGQAYF